MDKISPEQIKNALKKKGLEVNIVKLKDTLGNQELFRVEIKGVPDLKNQELIKQEINAKFHTKVTDVRFLGNSVNENMHYDYNGSHMLVYDIDRKYDNVYSGKLQIQIDDNVYGYDILFDDMKGIIEWDKDYVDINKEHRSDGTSRDFKGLVDMFNIDLQNHVSIEKHVKPTKSKKKKKGEDKPVEIIINFDQAKGLASYLHIINLNLPNTTFNKMVQELSSQSLQVRYKKREEDVDQPTEIFIGRSGNYLTDNDITGITKILSKAGIDTSNYQYVNVRNLSLLPASALIRTSLAADQLKDL